MNRLLSGLTALLIGAGDVNAQECTADEPNVVINNMRYCAGTYLPDDVLERAGWRNRASFNPVLSDSRFPLSSGLVSWMNPKTGEYVIKNNRTDFIDRFHLPKKAVRVETTQQPDEVIETQQPDGSYVVINNFEIRVDSFVREDHLERDGWRRRWSPSHSGNTYLYQNSKTGESIQRNSRTGYVTKVSIPEKTGVIETGAYFDFNASEEWRSLRSGYRSVCAGRYWHLHEGTIACISTHTGFIAGLNEPSAIIDSPDDQLVENAYLAPGHGIEFTQLCNDYSGHAMEGTRIAFRAENGVNQGKVVLANSDLRVSEVLEQYQCKEY